MSADNKVTIYLTSSWLGMGVRKYEARLVDHGRRKYAQYQSAPFVHFIPKRKRKVRQYVEGYKPYALILAGWGHPSPDDPFVPVRSDDKVEVSQSRYTLFDERWDTDFDSKIDAYVALLGVEVVADYRWSSQQGAA